MPADSPFPSPLPGQTLLLSAGPGAGKTRLLRHWSASLTLPTLYFRLEPEDRAPEFLRYRLARAFSSVTPERWTPSGAAWGSAWGPRLPAIALLLDDWQAIEGTEAERQLTELVWNLPSGAVGVLASRHRFAAKLVLTGQEWGPDHPGWQERPSLADFDALPPLLQEETLALALVGEAPEAPNGQELFRRNVARLDETGHLALRAAWVDLARSLVESRTTLQVAERAEALLDAFIRRHRWTPREAEIGEMLDRFPRDLQARRPALLKARGQEFYEAAEYAAALACFERALAQGDRTFSRAPELRAARLLCLIALMRPLEARDVAELEGWRESGPAGLWLLFAYSHWRWHQGDMQAAVAAQRELAAQPDPDERTHAYPRFVALNALTDEPTSSLEDTLQSLAQLEAQAEARRFTLKLPQLLMARQTLLLGDQTRIPPPERLAALPNDVFAASSRKWLPKFISLQGQRAEWAGAYEAALRLFEFNEAHMRGVQLGFGHLASVVRSYQIRPLVRLNRLEEAERLYAELAPRLDTPQVRHILQMDWGRLQLERGELGAARESLCAPELASYSPRLSPLALAQRHLYQEALRSLEGDPEACERLSAWLETPPGALLSRTQARFLQRLGLGSAAPAFRLWAFGPCEFSREDRASPRWPRRKALALLAHLTLRPEGVPSAELATLLFEEGGKTPPLQTLHIVAHALRQTLHSVGAEHVFEANQGLFRLRWDLIAYCDLHEFDAFYQRARTFEAEGTSDLAAAFYGIALCHARGELFENLPEEFGAERTSYRQRVRHARTFAMRYAAVPHSLLLSP